MDGEIFMKKITIRIILLCFTFISIVACGQKEATFNPDSFEETVEYFSNYFDAEPNLTYRTNNDKEVIEVVDFNNDYFLIFATPDEKVGKIVLNTDSYEEAKEIAEIVDYPLTPDFKFEFGTEHSKELLNKDGKTFSTNDGRGMIAYRLEKGKPDFQMCIGFSKYYIEQMRTRYESKFSPGFGGSYKHE